LPAFFWCQIAVCVHVLHRYCSPSGPELIYAINCSATQQNKVAVLKWLFAVAFLPSKTNFEPYSILKDCSLKENLFSVIMVGHFLQFEQFSFLHKSLWLFFQLHANQNHQWFRFLKIFESSS
jgi:hypothetical protein